MILLLVGVAGVLAAAPSQTPEIDAGSAGSAIALLSGALLIFKSRRK
jgi:hypothetical protein